MSSVDEEEFGKNERTPVDADNDQNTAISKKKLESMTNAELIDVIRRMQKQNQDKINRKAKDSLFTDLFHRPEYALQLYRCLHPEDTTVSEQDIDIVTLRNILAVDQYNDLGLLIRNTLIVLTEAQSVWSINVIYRLDGYRRRSEEEYLTAHGADVHSTVKVRPPDVEAYVIYTGKKLLGKTEWSLRHEFYNNDPNKPELIVNVLQGENVQGIIKEYIDFSEIFDKWKAAFPDDEAKALTEIIKECKKKGALVQYLSDHEAEVRKIMSGMYQTVDASHTTLRTRMALAVLHFAVKNHLPEDNAVRDVSETYGISPEVTQTFLEYVKEHPDPREW